MLITIGITLLYILGNYLLTRTPMSLPPPMTGGLFLILMGVVAYLYREDLKDALAPFQLSRWTFFYLGLQLLFSVLILSSLDHLNSYLGEEGGGDPLSEFRHSSAPMMTAILSLSVLPPITEEVVFRGLLFGQLLRAIDLRSSLIVSSFLFAWVHFSFISLLWLFPQGLYLGWVRHQEGTLWVCMLCHSLHNSLALYWMF